MRSPRPRPSPRRAACSVFTLALLVVSASAVVAWEDGARPTHWSLRPLVRPPVPEVAGASHPIDAFVLARLAAAGLEPAPRADARTLVRRLSYDLTGLPPEPGDVERIARSQSNRSGHPRFDHREVSRPAPGADDRAWLELVDRLLASPRHAEHVARHWLDVAAYADTHGNDHDYARWNAWPYRDWVIGAFAADEPYARFVEKQVAGDVLFPDDPGATVALGFVAAGPWDHTLMVTVRKDTIDHLSSQNLDRDAMVSAVMGTFQSLTVHCARCHDHKFDPISQREYYSLQAVFAGVDRADRPFDDDPHVHAARRRLLAERRTLEGAGASLDALLDSRDTARRVAEWEAAQGRAESAWRPLDVSSVVSTDGSTPAPEADGSWFVGGERPVADTYVVTARWPGGVPRAVRLEVLPDERLPHGGPGRWDNGNFHLSELRILAAATAASGPAPISIAQAAADWDEGVTISAAQAIDGVDASHWGIHPRYGEPHAAVFTLHDPPDLPDGAELTIRLEHRDGVPGHGIGRFRLSVATGDVPPPSADPLPAALVSILRAPPEARAPEARRALALEMLRRENRRALALLPPPRMVYAIASDFAPDGANFVPPSGPRPIHRLDRGDLLRPREPVEPGTIACLPDLDGALDIDDATDESARRAALARWLVDERNVLTWRSIVNRVWSWHFGRGLAATPNDFGRMGEPPSHPELLDWLAIWFRDDAKGSLRALHRLIVTSETWRRSTFDDTGSAVDPDAALLWRQRRRRLSAEEMRDTLLALSRRLDTTVGGPPAVQFVSRGDATFMPGGNPAFVDYASFDPDALASRRRSIYRFLFRTVPDPLMDALDCPDGSAPIARRGESTTAQQALALLNDPFVIRQTEHIAARIASRATTAEERAEGAFRTILLRSPDEDERRAVAVYIERHGLANACHWLLHANEFFWID